MNMKMNLEQSIIKFKKKNYWYKINFKYAIKTNAYIDIRTINPPRIF